jgi:hypothetical protein
MCHVMSAWGNTSAVTALDWLNIKVSHRVLELTSIELDNHNPNHMAKSLSYSTLSSVK